MPTFPKHITYLLIAILIIALACLYFAFTNKRDTDDQSDLMMAMAEKLRVDDAPEKKSTKKDDPEPDEITEQQNDQIVNIADKLCFNKPLSAPEKEFKKKFNQEINEELEKSKRLLSLVINKFLNGVKEFDEFEKIFYESNQAEINTIVQNKKYFTSVIKKLTDGQTDFSEEELQFQKNYPKEIESELKRLKEGAEKLKGANPPYAASDRLKNILSLFDDGIPKIPSEITKLYAEKTQTKAHTGNMSAIISKMVEEHQLLNIKIGGKVYHGPPEWFDGRKLKPEYKEKIA